MQSTPQNSTSTPLAKSPNLIALSFLFMAFLTGIASSFQIPTLSLFLSQEVKVSAFWVGLFYSANAVIGIIISQIIARYSDRLPDRRKIIIGCCLVAVLGSLLFAYSRNYGVLILLGTTLLGLGSATNPQSFALAREYADNSQRNNVMFTTVMRTQISLAWIIGPPLSFFIATTWGFSYMYLVAGLAFLLCAGVTLRMLPKIERKIVAKTDHNPTAISQNRFSIVYLFIAVLLLMTCNGMYLINMPLFVIKELQLETALAGTLMGTAAGLEIPMMLTAGYLSKFFSKKSLLFASMVAGLAFYVGILWANQNWQFIALQLLNAIFIGIVATIGMVYFQDLMPEKMGSATTLFSNAAKGSWIVAGPIAGVITQYWHYSSVFYVSQGLILLSMLCLMRVKNA